MRALLIALSLVAIVIEGAATAASRIYSQDEIDATLVRAGLDARQAAFRKSTPRELEARLSAALADRALHPIVREKTLADGALALGLQPRTPSAEALVARIATLETEVRVRFSDGEHAAMAVPAFAPATAARNAQKHWVRTETAAAVGAGIVGGRPALGAAFSRAEDSRVIAAGIADAVIATARTPEGLAALRASRPAFEAALRDGRPIEDALAELAVATRDRDTALSLIAHGDPALTVHQLARLRDALPPADALLLLQRASSTSELASSALLALGGLAALQPAARDHLFAVLGDRRDGGSAAAALAALHDPALVVALAEHARRSPDLLAARRAALALHLDGSPAATAALAALIDDPRVGADARRWMPR